MGKGALCRHCAQRYSCRPRGLCWICYYNPSIRPLYPENKAWWRPSEDSNGGYREPETWTDALPGTPEKVAVLIEREDAKTSLNHPLDLTGDPRRDDVILLLRERILRARA